MSRSPVPRGPASPPPAAALLLWAVLWAGAAAAQGVEVEPGVVADLEVGIFCTEETGERTPAPGSVAGHSNTVANIEHRAETFVVPVVPELTFGFRARFLQDAPEAVFRITHPPFRGSGATEQWFLKGMVADGVETGLYAFDEPYEMVTGLWRMEVVDGDRTLFAASFRTVPAELAPDLAGLCAGEPAISALPGGDALDRG